MFEYAEYMVDKNSLSDENEGIRREEVDADKRHRIWLSHMNGYGGRTGEKIRCIVIIIVILYVREYSHV